MYKWKKGDGKTMAAVVVAGAIGAITGFICSIYDIPSPMEWVDNLFTRAADFILIFIFLAVSGVISFINK
ncbi:hypothetical protein, partial [Ligilactobacillus sp.]|uniref:hypothetical protein n=1 Tax=Ligilactobacillus sp. TaxID=2767921 RepID=UPI002FE3079D